MSSLKSDTNLILPGIKSIKVIQNIWFVISVYLLLGWVLFENAPSFADSDDVEYWRSWAQHIYRYGIGELYTDPSCNYHPIWPMMMGVEIWLKGEWFLEGKNFLSAKIWPLLFDGVGAFCVFLLVKRSRRNVWVPLLALLNIAYIYNSWVWFQVDSIHTAFSLLALIFILRGKLIVAFLFLILAINTKLQAIIFFPAVGLLILPFFMRSAMTLAIAALSAVLLQGAILFPFWQAGTLSQLWGVVTNAHHVWPVVSMNAYNLWFLFISEPSHVNDNGILALGLSFKQIGLGLFLVFSAITLLPLVRRCWLWIQNNSVPNLSDAPLVMLSVSTIALVFFFFNTEMHERYIHPAILALFYYGALTKRWWFYGLFSLAYFTNIISALNSFFEGIWVSVRELIEYFAWMCITHIGLSLPKLVAIMYLMLLLVSLWELYTRHWCWPVSSAET